MGMGITSDRLESSFRSYARRSCFPILPKGTFSNVFDFLDRIVLSPGRIEFPLYLGCQGGDQVVLRTDVKEEGALSREKALRFLCLVKGLREFVEGYDQQLKAVLKGGYKARLIAEGCSDTDDEYVNSTFPYAFQPPTLSQALPPATAGWGFFDKDDHILVRAGDYRTLHMTQVEENSAIVGYGYHTGGVREYIRVKAEPPYVESLAVFRCVRVAQTQDPAEWVSHLIEGIFRFYSLRELGELRLRDCQSWTIQYLTPNNMREILSKTYLKKGFEIWASKCVPLPWELDGQTEEHSLVKVEYGSIEVGRDSVFVFYYLPPRSPWRNPISTYFERELAPHSLHQS